MATPAELALLRDMTSEPDNGDGWTDEKLEVFIEASRNTNGTLNLRAAAGKVWEAKAASLTELTDVAESGSSQRLSQAFDHAVKMAGLFGATDDDPTLVAAAGRIKSNKLIRAPRG